MAGPGRALTARRKGYRARGPARLSRPNAPWFALAAILLGLAGSGCSFSYQLGSLLGDDADKPTQSVLAKPAPRPEGASGPGPQESDLVHARAAVAEALAKGGATRSTPWENPATGARGTVTPIATAYTQDGGFVCRDFLASYVHEGNETWLEGEACRVHQGRWEVRRLKSRAST